MIIKYRRKKRKGNKNRRIRIKSRRDYSENYLRSEHWLDIKKRLNAKWQACRLCGSTKFLNIHHITYRRLGFEFDSDLIVLCEECHIERVHKGLVTKEELFAITGGSEKEIRRKKKNKEQKFQVKSSTSQKPFVNMEKILLRKMGSIAYFQMNVVDP